MNKVQPDAIRYFGGWTILEYARGACPCGIKEAAVKGAYKSAEEAQAAAWAGAEWFVFHWKIGTAS
jgi:hypothetical protein